MGVGEKDRELVSLRKRVSDYQQVRGRTVHVTCREFSKWFLHYIQSHLLFYVVWRWLVPTTSSTSVGTSLYIILYELSTKKERSNIGHPVVQYTCTCD